MASHAPADTSPLGIDRRARRRRHRLALIATRVAVVLALALVLAAGTVAGVRGFTYPLLLGVLLVLPGDLARRAVLPAHEFGSVETLAVDFGASCVVLTLVGLLAVALGVADRVGVLVVLGVIGATCVVIARVRRDRAGRGASVSATVRAVAAVVVLAAVGAILFEVTSLVGDRIYLGQLRTTVEVVHRGALPATTWTYGVRTPFPSNYVLYNLLFAAIGWIGGFDSWHTWREFTGIMRVVQVGLFGFVWYLVGMELLRGFRRGLASRVCATAVPILLLYNFGFIAKFRDPLIEGFGTVLVGVALWALMRSTGNRGPAGRPLFFLSVAVTALLLGVHLPVFGEAVVLVAAWCLLMPPGRRTREIPWYRRPALLDRLRATARCGLFYAAGVVVVLVMLMLAVGTTPIGGATAPVSARGAYRAYLLYLGQPISTEPLRYYVMQRVSRSFLLIVSPFTGTAVVLAGVALLGLLLGLGRRIRRYRPLLWILAVGVLTALYVTIGFWRGRTEVTPWNAVTRNGFYLWLPCVLAIAFGLRQFFAWIEPRPGSRLRTLRHVATALLAVVLVVGAVRPLWHQYGPTLTETGWIVVPPMSRDGERALEWLDANTEPSATVMLSEQTFGSSVISRRRMVTEGFATLESKEVTRAANEALPLATELLLPVHSPRVLRRYGVDYVVAREGVYGFGEMGGTPLLAQFGGPLTPVLPQLALGSLPYLHEVQRFGDIVVYRVEKAALPDVRVVYVGVGEPVPQCTAEECIVYQRTAKPLTCAPDQISPSPWVCIRRLQFGESG